MEVYLQCNKVKGKLRINVISLGYNNDANCRFPKALRVEGRQYKISSNNLGVQSSKNGTCYYIVRGDIEIVKDVKPERIFEIKLCVVCLTNPSQIVYIPCCHQVICKECDIHYKGHSCPMCRTTISRKIDKENFI